MSIDADEEILQDFLIEGSEILEELNEQLVELEHRPEDNELLNAVFRGFHTIKGGASFLNLEGMVEVCHKSEDVFNILRNGEKKVDAKLMDFILPVLDLLDSQFKDLKSGSTPNSADATLLRNLESLLQPNQQNEATKSTTVQEQQTVQSSVGNSSNQIEESSVDAVDSEFEDILAQNAGNTIDQKNSYDEITEEEFDALLDKLHGNSDGNSTAKSESVKKANVVEDKKKVENEEISEEEFEELLDKLHGPANSNQSKSTPVKSNPTASNVKESVAQVKPDATKSKEKDKLSSVSQPETTVRVDTKRLDEIMNLVGELVLVRNRLATLESLYSDEEMTKVVTNLDVVTSDLQTAVMKTRMQPIKKVFGRFPRVVRDLARNLNKEVNLELQGEETDLDKNLVEALADPLVHLVRNAVDHGIEMPDERERAKKPRAGTIILGATQEGDHILLSIEDDGAGMDAAFIKKKVVEKGLLDFDTVDRLDDRECYNLIFLPGFSTKSVISDISGRGVGMDVVKNRIAQLNGIIEIDSKKGRGTTLLIKVPLTLAIMPTLMVMLKNQIFALPLVNVSEIIHLNLNHTNVIDGQLVVMVRQRALPLFYLRHWLVKGSINDQLPESGHIVVVSVGAQRVGFVVDHLIGQEEVVIKPLGAMLLGTKGLAGATITGDGRIALILDVPELMQAYAGRI